MLMRRVSHFVFTFLFLFFLLPFSQALGGEEELFTSSAQPDALLLMDWSGSMAWNPSGDAAVWGTDQTCTNLSSTYNATSRNVKCSRLEIAKRAIFALLDADGNGTINAADQTALGVRFGYMRFYSSSSSTTGISTPYAIGSNYSQIFCGAASCTITTSGTAANNATYTGSTNYINGQGATGGTPLNGAMSQAKTYLNNHKATDVSSDCRKKYLILVSDGADTYGCSGNGSECQTGQYKRRRDSVHQAKELAAAGYQVFVIGLGASMPTELMNTLNWMAYYGGTENPGAAKTGVDPAGTSRYKPESYTTASVCTAGSNGANNAPSCTTTGYFATDNDPGRIDLRGYAFMAANALELGEALKMVIKMVRQGSYSFTNVSVETIRTEDEDYLYKASFEPSDDPFWKGHLRQHEYQSDGTPKATATYDVGDRFPASRTIKTYLGAAAGTLVDFNATNITSALLDTANNTERDTVINYVRGTNTASNPDGWLLGDISRAGPVTIGSPSAYYRDLWDTNGAFADFRTNSQRTSANGKRIVVAGTNAGQVHGFRTSTGTELWSFIPPNLLPKLKSLAHTTHPSDLPHQYLVDGQIKVADAWLGSGNGKIKSASDWKTLLIFGEGRGAGDTLWSSSASCSTGFSRTYSAATPRYCGYHALDVTNTGSPSYGWNLNFSGAASSAPYMGDPWNEMQVGRVRTSVAGTDTERWIGFIGGGYNPLAYNGSNESLPGKAVYAVELKNGEILWSYTHGSSGANANMTHSIPAPATLVDTDGDGFTDIAYVGDLWGNMWRFTFCRAVDMASGCSIAGWSGSLFLKNNMTNATPIYTPPVVSLDSARKPWVFWGTGDKNNPTATGTQDYFYGVKDVDRTDTLNATSFSSSASDVGWRITLAPREKVLSKATVFDKVLYFVTYTPPSDAERAASPCSVAGKAKLYGVHFLTAVGIFAGEAKSIDIGEGIPSDVNITLAKDGNVLVGNIVVSTSNDAGGADGAGGTSVGGGGGGGKVGGGGGGGGGGVGALPPFKINMKNTLYWKDSRIAQ